MANGDTVVGNGGGSLSIGTRLNRIEEKMEGAMDSESCEKAQAVIHKRIDAMGTKFDSFDRRLWTILLTVLAQFGAFVGAIIVALIKINAGA